MKQLRYTRQRQLVLEAVQAHCDHPSADNIYIDVRLKDDKISRGTVYRNLNLLAENGEITQVVVPTADRYDLRLDKHYHVFCVKCGAVCDASIDYQPEYDRSVEAITGYTISRHRMVFEGICSSCESKLASPLAQT